MNNTDVSALEGKQFLRTVKKSRVPFSALAVAANVSLDDIKNIELQSKVSNKYISAYHNCLNTQK